MATNTEKTEPKPSANKPSLWSLVALIVSLLALGLTANMMHNYQSLHSQFTEETKALADEIRQLNQSETEAQKQVTNTESGLQTRIDALNKQMSTALAEIHYKNDDWILLKARYYLELAQINSHWGTDLKTTTALLQQADTVLKQLNDNKVFTIRQKLAEEVAQLQAINILDTAGILSKLDAAQSSLDGLSIPTNFNPNQTAKNQAANESGWRKNLQNSVGLLEKLVVVRRNNEDLRPLLSPAYESLIKESIRLNLQEAQWAVLNKNNLVYQLALKQALHALEQAFNPSNQLTQALLTQITQLQQVQLQQQIPDIGATLPLLNQLIETKDKQVGDKQP